MLQKHNTVVKIWRVCLTRGRRFTSLCIMRAGSDRFRLLVRWLLLAGVGVALSACAAIERAEVENAKQQVSERVQQRWDLLAKGQVEGAYEYFSPTTRSTLPLEIFRKRARTARSWKSMKLEKVDCRADTCQVTIAMEYDIREIKGLKATVEETWVKEAGAWGLISAK